VDEKLYRKFAKRSLNRFYLIREMNNSKNIAGLIGPSLIAITIPELFSTHIWASTAYEVYVNGSLLFVAGLAIVRAHNHWVKSWPVVITFVGWFLFLGGLFRMFAPEMQLESAKNTASVIAITIFVLLIGVFLSFKAYW
jgi:hypothetical protein